jgi:hypothetical protein
MGLSTIDVMNPIYSLKDRSLFLGGLERVSGVEGNF